MALQRKQTLTVAVCCAALAVSGVVLFSMYGPEGCGVSEEQERVLAGVNTIPDIVDRNGHVESVTLDRSEGHGDNVYRFDGEVLDNDGVAIGRVRGGRVEGFGTMRPHVMWYKTPGVPEEWPERPRGERRHRDHPREEGPRGQTPETPPQ